MSDNVDRLSDCAVLPQILSFLPKQTLFDCLTVNKRVYQEIARNGRSLAKIPVKIQFDFGKDLWAVDMFALPLVPGEFPKSQLFEISDNFITSRRNNFPIFMKSAVTPRGHEVNTAPMNSFEICSRLEGARITLEAILGYLQMNYLFIKDSGSGMYDAVLALILESGRLYKGNSDKLSIWFKDDQFRPEYLEIIDAFESLSYQMFNDLAWHASLLNLPVEAMPVNLDDNYTWKVSDMHQFIESWKSGDRQINMVQSRVANVTPQMIGELARLLGVRVNSKSMDINDVPTTITGFAVRKGPKILNIALLSTTVSSLQIFALANPEILLQQRMKTLRTRSAD